MINTFLQFLRQALQSFIQLFRTSSSTNMSSDNIPQSDPQEKSKNNNVFSRKVYQEDWRDPVGSGKNPNSSNLPIRRREPPLKDPAASRAGDNRDDHSGII